MTPPIHLPTGLPDEPGRRRPWMRFAGALLLMHVAGTLASAWAFPYGGGAFHAMFAYSTGDLDAALTAWYVRVGAVVATAMLLVGGGYRIRWYAAALAATATAGGYWWIVCTWEPQAPLFHLTVGMMLYPIPLIAFIACGVVHFVRARLIGRPPALDPLALYLEMRNDARAGDTVPSQR